MPAPTQPSMNVVLSLVEILDRNGITYPAEVHRGIASWTYISDPTTTAITGRYGREILDWTPEETLAEVRESTWHRGLEQDFKNQIGAFNTHISTNIVQVLAAGADDLIDQLRPRFDTAALAVTAAVKAGITATTTADQILTMNAAAIKAWQQLDPALAELNQIHGVRTHISSAVCVAPLHPQRDVPGDHNRPELWATCYGSGQPWHLRTDVTPASPWLRLAQYGLRLCTVRETAAAVPGRDYIPIVPVMTEAEEQQLRAGERQAVRARR